MRENLAETFRVPVALHGPPGETLLGTGRATALRFEAGNIGWTHGDGPWVAGAGEALARWPAGRSPLDELRRGGVASLRSTVIRRLDTN